MLCYLVVCCVVSCCVVSCCVVLCCVALRCVALRCVMLCCVVLCCVVANCLMLLYCIASREHNGTERDTESVGQDMSMPLKLFLVSGSLFSETSAQT